jgi:hypothetical protein
MNKTRQKQLTFRCTENEYTAIKKKIEESGYRQQEYLLRAALNQEVIGIQTNAEILHELKKQGGNLNQIAHHLNANNRVSDQEILKEIEEVKKLWQSLRQSLLKRR